MIEAARFVSGLTLLVLPGAWIAFGLPLQPLGSFVRLAAASLLSPAVILLELYVLRWAGLPFEHTTTAIVVLNLPAAAVVFRGWKSRVSAGDLIAAAGVFLLLCVPVVLPWLSNPQTRIFTGHTFMHMGLVYQFPAGALVPEDAQFAGLRVAYPWMAHAYWAVVAHVFDWAPTRTFVVTNLVSLASAGLLFHGICQALGTGATASRIGMLWLGFGTNGLGALGWSLLLAVGQPFLIGDSRYTTWLRKYPTMQATTIAVGLLGVVVLSAVWSRRTRHWGWLTALVLSVAGLGLFYSMLLPVALAVCGTLVIAMWRDRQSRDLMYLCAGLAVATGMSAWFTLYIASSRQGSLVSLATPEMMLTRLASSIVVLGPFAAALWFARGRIKTSGILPLLAAAAITNCAAILIRLGNDDHQYKFMFGTALLMAPAVALAAEDRLRSRAARWLLVLGAVVLMVPVSRFSMARSAVGSNPLPVVDDSHFLISLKPGEKFAEVARVLEHDTPRDTVILTNINGFSLPAVSRRSLFVAPDTSGPGFWLQGRWLIVHVLGYPEHLYSARRELIRTVFEGDSAAASTAALEGAKALGRPLALVFGPGEGSAIQAQFEGTGARRLLADPGGYSVWLLPAPAGSRSQ